MALTQTGKPFLAHRTLCLPLSPLCQQPCFVCRHGHCSDFTNFVEVSGSFPTGASFFFFPIPAGSHPATGSARPRPGLPPPFDLRCGMISFTYKPFLKWAFGLFYLFQKRKSSIKGFDFLFSCSHEIRLKKPSYSTMASQRIIIRPE